MHRDIILFSKRTKGVKLI